MLPLTPVVAVHRILRVYMKQAVMLFDVNRSADAVVDAFVGTHRGYEVFLRWCHIIQFDNPFDIDWGTIDLKDEAHLDYMEVVVDVLSSHVTVWGDASPPLSVFLEMLKVVLVFARSYETRHAFATGDVLAPAA